MTEADNRVALVLGGGGITGGLYEIGALRALDLMLVDRRVHELDIYVGTSAGALIAAMCASGVTPDEMMRAATRDPSSPFRDIGIRDLLSPNFRELARKGVVAPGRLASFALAVARQRRDLSLLEVVLTLSEGLPSGWYTGAGIERYVRRTLQAAGGSDDFRDLTAELYLAATDLDTCERIVLGATGFDDVPISRAVRASSALPMIYAPVRIKQRDLVDGGIVSTTNLDLAVDAGARLVVVVNPIVPFVNPSADTGGKPRSSRPRRISDRGLTGIGYQAFRLLAYQRLHELARSWEERYPGVDIILIEPPPDDALMFDTSMMSFSSRIEIARHGFESVTAQLAGDFERVSGICERHGGGAVGGAAQRGARGGSGGRLRYG